MENKENVITESFPRNCVNQNENKKNGFVNGCAESFCECVCVYIMNRTRLFSTENMLSIWMMECVAGGMHITWMVIIVKASGRPIRIFSFKEISIIYAY